MSKKIKMLQLVNKLRLKLGRDKNGPPGFINEKAIHEADMIIADLCKNSFETIGKNLEAMEKLWLAMRDMPEGPDRDAIAREIHMAAHEIKDIGSMCGYGLASFFAESLRDYIGLTELSVKAQRVIVQAHVDALLVTHKQGIKADGGPIAEELKKAVKIAVDKYS